MYLHVTHINASKRNSVSDFTKLETAAKNTDSEICHLGGYRASHL